MKHAYSNDPLAALKSLVTPASLGVEIGAHSLPVEGLRPLFVDCVEVYSGVQGRVDLLADGRFLPFPDHSLDYLCASHVLEHMPNPIASLLEWHRVLKPGGCLYVIVPDMQHTFDCKRAVTTPEHILQDFLDDRQCASAEHIDDFVFNTDWSKLRPHIPTEGVAADRAQVKYAYTLDLEAGRYVDIHYHTFTPDSFLSLLQKARIAGDSWCLFDLLAKATRFPSFRGDGIGVALKKRGAFWTRPYRGRTALLERGERRYPLVDPVSLRPLKRSESGGLVLQDGGGALSYTCRGALFDMLPDVKQVQRSWRDPAFRRRFLKWGRFCLT